MCTREHAKKLPLCAKPLENRHFAQIQLAIAVAPVTRGRNEAWHTSVRERGLSGGEPNRFLPDLSIGAETEIRTQDLRCVSGLVYPQEGSVAELEPCTEG